MHALRVATSRGLRALAVAGLVVGLGLPATVRAQTLCGNGIVDVGEACDDGNTVGGDCCSADCQTLDPTCNLGLDHFQCYQAKEAPKTAKFPEHVVSLADQFETVDTVAVKHPRFICAPVDKNGEGIMDPTAHQTCYTIRDDRSLLGRFQKREVIINNQFGLQRLVVTRPNHLCLPASKAIPPGQPSPTTPDIDHYRCYKAKPVAGSLKPSVQVTLEDQFDRRVKQTRACVRLCTPVSKNGEPIDNPDAHLVCYRVIDRSPKLGDMYGGVANGSTANPGGVLLVDQGDGSGFLLGDPVTPGGISGLAFDSTGRLFATTATGVGTASDLVELDPDDGSLLATVGTVSGTLRIGDLAFQPGTDVLYGIGQDARVYTIDVTSAAATLVGDPGLGDNGGLAFAPDGTLYLATTGFATLQLVTLDPANAAVQSSVVTDRGIDGLGIRQDGTLFATVSGQGGKTDLVVTLDPATGGTTALGNTGTGAPSDLDFRPTDPLPVFNVNTHDQFGDLTLRVRNKASKFLCVPSTKILAP
jgi:cysteine-rich repeat protein